MDRETPRPAGSLSKIGGGGQKNSLRSVTYVTGPPALRAHLAGRRLAMSFTAAVAQLRTLLDIPQELSISVAVAKMSGLMGLPVVDAAGAFVPLPAQVALLQDALGVEDGSREEGSVGCAAAARVVLELGGSIDGAVALESDSDSDGEEASGLRKKRKPDDTSRELRQCVCCPHSLESR